jgi:transcriptional regulator GlxA family with amidase domain
MDGVGHGDASCCRLVPQIGIGMNDNNRLNHAMTELRRIVLITYDGAELLDVAGPSAVFSTANRIFGNRLYEIIVASPHGSSIAHSCGIEMATVPLRSVAVREGDTILVVGADARPLAAAMPNAELTRSLQSAVHNASRYGSICTGVFVLAAAGLLDGKAVATHWAAVPQLKRLFANVRCDADALYVIDGCVWTSAGVTTGIDMALAMLEHDHGPALKARVARQLVVYSHRPGHQSQFSDLLAAQGKEDTRFAGLVDWLNTSTATPISIEQMADYVGMSPRSFHRRFVQSFGQPPAKFFETLRLNAARRLLETRTSVAHAAREAGFRSESSFRTSFKGQFGVTPQHYRQNWQKP